MIPAPFDYVAPASVEEALAALAEHGDDAKIMAGGQSLLPVLRMRLNAPEMVIDLGRIDSLRGVRDDGDAIVIGALTTHSEMVTNDLAKGFKEAYEGLKKGPSRGTIITASRRVTDMPRTSRARSWVQRSA